MFHLTHKLTVDDTKEVKLLYYRPRGELNWGIDLSGADMEQDVSTPLILILPDFPGHRFDANDNLFGEIAGKLQMAGLPSLGIEYRGTGDTDVFAGHFDLDTAAKDVEAALTWVLSQDEYTKIIPVTSGMSTLVMLRVIERYKMHWGTRFMTYKAKKSLGAMVAESQAELQDSVVDGLDLSRLHLLAMAMFWPVLDPRGSRFYQAHIKDEDGRPLDFDKMDGFAAGGVKPFTGMPVRNDYMTYSDPREDKLSIDFMRQLAQEDVSDVLRKVRCPVLVQKGTDDTSTQGDQLDILRQNCASQYIDIQIYGGGAYGLKERNIRPLVMHLTEEFIRRFS